MNAFILDLLQRFSSRKFLALVGFTLILLADNAGLKLDPQIRPYLLTAVLAYIGLEGTADAIARGSQSNQ